MLEEKQIEMALEIQREYYIRSREGMQDLTWKVEAILEEQGLDEEAIEKYIDDTPWEDCLRLLSKNGEI